MTSTGGRVNGSSPYGHCTSILEQANWHHKICNTPLTSVLFDSHYPRFTGGSSWATDLLTLQPNRSLILQYRDIVGFHDHAVVISFDFSSELRLGEVQVSLFNCPQWGIYITNLSLHAAVDGGHVRLNSPRFSSAFNAGLCDNFWRVHMHPPHFHNHQTFLLVFGVSGPDTWVHLAEITFYAYGHVPTDVIPVATQTTGTGCLL
jgi:hypothetical protein